jgi:flagellar hook-associated protein 2
VSDLNGSHAAEDLGINTAASGGAINGTELVGGLKTTLLKSLNGGQGLGALGELDLTNRNGQTASADLSNAQTLDDVLAAINGAGNAIGVSAAYNSARDGIVVTDASGGTNNFIIANGDATNTADALKLTTNAAVSSVNSGDYHERFVGENATLSSLNGGGGVAAGTFSITDTNGKTGTVTVSTSTNSIGDVIDAINRLAIGVQARVNDTGDGLLLVDTAAGAGSLSVTEGNSSAAHDLHLLGGQTTETVNGQPTKVIDGSNTTTVTISSTDTLQDVTNKINGLGYDVSANIFSTGSSVKPYRFTLTSQQSGRVGALQIDTSNASFSFSEIAKAQDAVLAIGDSSSGLLATSSTNSFSQTLPGVTLNILNTSATPITVSVGTTTTNLQTAIQALVTTYNKLNANLQSVTDYDTTSNTGAILFGDATTQSIQHQVSNLFTSRLFGAGSITSLTQLGISFGADGTATLDTDQLQSLLTQNPSAVQTFLSKTSTGFAAQLDRLGNSLAGTGNSLILSRTTAIDNQTTANNNRITDWNKRLSVLSANLTNEYEQNELALAQIQSSYAALSSVAQLANLGVGNTSTSSNSTSTNAGNTNSALGSATVNS